MNRPLQTDRQELGPLLNRVRDFALAFRQDEQRRTAPDSAQLPPGSTLQYRLPEEGWGGETALDECLRSLEPYLVASPSNRYLGYVTGGTTPAALVGDFLASVADQNPQGNTGTGDVSAAIELATIDLLLELFGLPKRFHGGFVTGATMSNFTSLAVARQWVGYRQGYDVAVEGLRQPIQLLTATPHSSATKSLAMLGMGSGNITEVATLPGREALDPADLERKVAALNGTPFILIASGGTVNTVDFDDLTYLAELKERHDFWLHVDAAFGGFAACSPDYAHLVSGWEAADSITIDNHKWLNVPYDSACWFIRREHLERQLATFRNGGAPYLGDASENYSYLNLGPENSRRLRALPAWFSLMAYGRAGYRDIVERCIATAKGLGEAITASPAFELLAPVRLNVVAFTLSGADAAAVDAFARRLNDRGRFFMTPTTLFGRRGVRAAFVNWRADPAQVSEIMSELDACTIPMPAPASAQKN